MTESSYGAERSQDDPIEVAPIGDETPGEYEPDGQLGGESPETGVAYERTGEPQATPHDVELTLQEEDEA